MRISDWSSDVCSSDLPHQLAIEIIERVERRGRGREFLRRDGRCRRDRDEPHRDEDRGEQQQDAVDFPEPEAERGAVGQSTEERRVGKGCGRRCRARWPPESSKKHTDYTPSQLTDSTNLYN